MVQLEHYSWFSVIIMIPKNMHSQHPRLDDAAVMEGARPSSLIDLGTRDFLPSCGKKKKGLC